MNSRFDLILPSASSLFLMLFIYFVASGGRFFVVVVYKTQS